MKNFIYGCKGTTRDKFRKRQLRRKEENHKCGFSKNGYICVLSHI